MHDPTILDGLRRKYQALSIVLDERARRQWAAAEARELGWGGITAVSPTPRLARHTIRTGPPEPDARAAPPHHLPQTRLRTPRARRQPPTAPHPGPARAPEAPVEPR